MRMYFEHFWNGLRRRFKSSIPKPTAVYTRRNRPSPEGGARFDYFKNFEQDAKDRELSKDTDPMRCSADGAEASGNFLIDSSQTGRNQCPGPDRGSSGHWLMTKRPEKVNPAIPLP